MAKLPNVTRKEIQALQDATDATIHEMRDIINRMEKGYCDEIVDPAAVARHFNAVARAASDVVGAMMVKMSLQEQKKELETLLRKQA